MIIQTSLVIFAVVFIYWLGCKRTEVKYGLIRAMTPEQYRSFTEIKLYIAKGIIVFLLLVIFLEKFNG